MLLVAPVHPARRAALAPGEQEQNGLAKLNVQRSQIPAVTHVDCSARVQTVRRQDNPAYYDLLSAFERLTGCPVLVNTSFNVRGEPIVCTPEQAYTCFMRTGIDALAIGRHLLIKDDQPPASGEQRWQEEFLLD
jgi:carbamoyltransferase